MEAAEKNAYSFKGTEVPIQKIRQSATLSGTVCRQNPAVSGNLCYRCGKKNRSAANCRFKDAVCNHCQKKGHLANVCHYRLAQQLTERSKPLSSKGEVLIGYTETHKTPKMAQTKIFHCTKLVTNLHTPSQLIWKLTKRS